MARVIQQLANVINILEDSKPVGEQIIDTLPLTTVVAIDRNQPEFDDIVIFDTPEGQKGSSLKFDGNIYIWPLGGSKTLFVGDIDSLVDSLNSSYFVSTVEISGTLPPAALTAITSTVNNGVEVTINTAVLAAGSNANRKQIKIHVELFDLWIRELGDLTDNSVRKGVKVQAGDTYIINADGGYIYTGPISVINAADGEKPFFYVTESI